MALALGLFGAAQAYETDQFTNRLQVIEDSREVLNEKVNEAIAQVIAKWRWKHDEKKFAHKVYRILGGRHWVDHIERWAMNSDEVAKIEVPRRGSIYHRQPIWATRIEDELKQRYQNLQLVDSSDLRLDRLCVPDPSKPQL